jgi:hypothetical protein
MLLCKRGKIGQILFFGAILVVAFVFLSLLRVYTGAVVYEDSRYNINEIPEFFEIEKGEEFYLDIDAPEGYIFSDDSELFDIDSFSGEIDFVPEDEGEYYFVIVALNSIEDFQYKLIKLRVVE